MTPDEARDLLDGTTPGPWYLSSSRSVDGIDIVMYDDTVMERRNIALAAAAPGMAAMIAGMHEEYAVSLPDGQLVGTGWGTYDTALEDMNAWRRDGYDARIVRRYVTEPEEA